MAEFIETNVQSSFSNMKDEFNRMFDQLTKKLSAVPVYAQWVKFQVGNFALDTSDPNQQYFVSLNYTKNGSGKANSFTLMIAYEPKMSGNMINSQDINLIDKQLCIYDGLSKDKLKCWLQYGYGHTPDKLISPLLEGMVIDYSPELRDGILYYTITGYSSLIQAVEDTVTIDEMKNTRPTEAVKKAIEDHIGVNAGDNNLGYEVQFAPGTEGSDKVIESIPGVADKNLFEYVSQTLNMAEVDGYVEDESKEEASKTRPYYIYDISETKDKKIITIEKIDPKSYNDEKMSNVVFEWGSKKNNFVRSWQPNIKGSVLLAQNYQYDKDQSQWGIDDSGEPVETKNMLKPPTSMVTNPDTPDATSIDESTELTTWSKAIQYGYEATLIIQGIPCDIPIGMYIKVTPLLYGQPHHSAGVYMVTKSSDTIDSGGFQTQIDLIKVDTSSDNKEGS